MPTLNHADQNTNTNRRQDVRLAAAGSIQVAVLDQHHQPVQVLHDAQALNVSANGLALTTATPANPGSRLTIHLADPNNQDLPTKPFELQALHCSQYHGDRHKIRCRLTKGHIPAKLIYNW